MTVSPQFLRESPEASTDQLSEVLRLVEVDSAFSGGFVVGGRWTTHFEPTSPLKLLAMVRGSARMCADGISGPVEIETGDVVVFNNRRWATLTGGPAGGLPVSFTLTEPNAVLRVGGGDDDVIMGGHIDVNGVGEELLVAALPPVVHVRASADDAAHLRDLLERMWGEVTERRMGATFAIDQLSQLLVLAVLRAYVTESEGLPAGWLRLLADERLRPAVQAMHTDPGKPWRLVDLAQTAVMSRSSFAERFRAVAGVPPLTYLQSWRMLLARQAMRHADTRVGPLSAELGFSSESAFSTAFKREVGMSPLRYRASRQ